MDIETNYRSLNDNAKAFDSGDDSNANALAVIIEYIDVKDKEYSHIIFDYEANRFIELSLYVFARLCNPDLVSLYFIIMIFYFGLYLDSFSVVLKSLTHVLITLIISLILKKFVGRDRPCMNSLSTSRCADLRGNESNCSMPSGDSMQSANFAIILLMYFRSYCGFLFIPFVMMGRIYFHCHYILDTVIGCILGLIISYGIYVLIN